MKKKDVLIIIPTLAGGGAERVASHLSMILSSEYNVHIILNEDIVTYPYNGEKHILKIGLSYVNEPIYKKIIRQILHAFKLFLIKLKFEDPICISFMEGANIANILTGGNVITSTHNYKIYAGSSNEKNDFLIKITMLLYKFSKINVVCSKEIEKMFKEKYKINNTITIYNPINLKEIQKMKKEKISKDEEKIFSKPTLITVGRLAHQKAQWKIIDALKILRKKKKDLNLVIISGGELENEIKQYIKKHKLENNVYLLGYQKNPFKYISRSKIFILSSYFEGFGLVIPEAMACGIPVISVDCKSGPKEIIDPQNTEKETKNVRFGEFGILIPPFKYEIPITDEKNKELSNVKKLAKAIELLMENEELYSRYSKKSLQRAKDFDADVIKHQWIELLKKLNN